MPGTIALKPPVWFTLNGMYCIEVQVKFADGLLRCGWLRVGTSYVYFRITYVCFIPNRLPVVAVEPQHQHRDFFKFVNIIIWRTHTKSFKKSYWFKIWMGFVGQILIKLDTSSIRGFYFFSCLCDTSWELLMQNMLVTTQWPLRRAPPLTSPHLRAFVWYGGLKAHWSYLPYARISWAEKY